jgi:hypothetical protein
MLLYRDDRSETGSSGNQGRFILRLGMSRVPPTSRGATCRGWVRFPAEERSHRTLAHVRNQVATEIWVRSEARFNDGRFRVTTEAQPPSKRSLRLHWPLAAVGVGRGYYLGEPSGAAVAAARRAGSPWPEQMDRKMLRFVEKTRNSHRQNAPSPDRSVVSAWRGIEARRPPLPGTRWPSRRSPDAAGSPLSVARETWLAPNVIGAWGVTTLSANLAGDDSLGGWDRAGNSQQAPSAEASDLGALPFGRRP